MRRLGLGVCLLFSLGLPAFAAQAVRVTRQQADTAFIVLTDQKEIRTFCESRGDTAPQVEAIKDLALNKLEDDGWELVLNGKGVDLTYVYVHVKGSWVNLAVLLNIPAENVSALLPADTQPMLTEAEYALLLAASPALTTADKRLNKAWKDAQGLVRRAEREVLRSDQKNWLLDRDKEVQRLIVRHKYHMSVPEEVLHEGRVNRERALIFLTEARAGLLEQYVKSLRGGRAEFSGVWSAEESESESRGLLLDDGLTFVYLCGSGDGVTIPPQVAEMPTGLRVRVTGRMVDFDRLRCSKDVKLEKLDPLPKKALESGEETVVPTAVVGLLGGVESETPYVDTGGEEYYTFSLDEKGGADCLENAADGALVVVSGSLTTPARGMPFFDPKAQTTCARLLQTN
jgi:uncharacterized protein YecT (DUF1311 family)